MIKREVAIPILLGIYAIELRRWLAEEDTAKGHAGNTRKGTVDHEKVFTDILAEGNNAKPT
ncbi:MAG: hypothetical protein NG712_05745 [Omnitrophica bacterium]|nr:hypothetical protein [Candidatus Omnitrophota bacterium]